ncbi:hypothetical protein KXD40_006377 [Peronospora effusa]|uniref:Uncharacterized protein n=1 Tax=Peronospora effusa TaxID=542832 RepID=A0A3M6VPN6_9STRA|nr:hypothetical protein DD238_001665 [Peronospora effusa]RQM16995.1 hypothetical protein DD237_001506 [Peronospora effusa]UIZ25648.1 hypothetical protein KXD40_006377 [Peronospora effusa]
MADAESDIIRLVNVSPQDVSDEVFAQELKKNHQCKKLRAACTQLGLHPQADPVLNHKDGYIQLLIRYRRSRCGEVSTGYSNATTKPMKRFSNVEVGGRTKHCGIKLVNVLFSRAFISRMAESGIVPSTGIKRNIGKMWLAYENGDPEFHRIAGPPGRYEGIDPRLSPHHSSAMLCSIWKDIATCYEKSIARWTQLGTENVDFAHFCNDVDVLYLYDKLQIQPIEANVEQLRASKRAKTRDVSQEKENDSNNADSENEEPLMERGNFLIPSESKAPPQRPVSSADDLQGLMYRRILPASSPEPVSDQHRDILEGQASTTSQDSRTPLEESMQQVLAATNEKRLRLDTYDGVIYSSQAVRDTMSAIEALKRGNYDHAIIAQATESMDAIVQVWLRELNKAGQARVP